MLPAADFIGDDPATDRAACLQSVEHFAACGIQSDEVSG
jgi:hypothetical protein